MYKATKRETKEVSGQKVLCVEFSNGTNSVIEEVKPQDKAGFLFWVKSRLAYYNGSVDVDAEYKKDAEIDVSTPEPKPAPAPTSEHLYWVAFRKLETIYRHFELGLITEAKYNTARDAVKANLKASYLT